MCEGDARRRSMAAKTRAGRLEFVKRGKYLLHRVRLPALDRAVHAELEARGGIVQAER